jgi:phosphoglycerate dehydrogenase-like enzyme
VFITPHNSAYSFPEDIVDIFAENYRLFVDGKPLKYLVDLDRGY